MTTTILLLASALKVLAIGNSYSASTLHELPQVAADLGFELDILSANIGGCSLEKHIRLMDDPSQEKRHSRPWYCQFSYADGQKPNLPNGDWNYLADAITADQWDVITIQQASFASWRPDTFIPWGDELVRRIRKLAPKAEIIVQETWADYPGGNRLAEWGLTRSQMYVRLHAAYAEFAKRHSLRVIPTGTAVEQVWARGLGIVQKAPDDSHLNPTGDFLQALVWAGFLSGADVTKGTYVPKAMPAKEAATLRKVAAAVLADGVPAPAVTAGWENFDQMRKPLEPANVIWQAPVEASAYRVEKRDGAEGTVTFTKHGITIEKTNEEGMIVVTAPSFVTTTNRFLRFMSDVYCDRGDYFYTQASMRVYGTKEFLDPDFPLEERFGYLGGADEMRATVHQAPGMTNRKFVHFQAREGVVTPVIIVHGAPSRMVWTKWRADDLDAADRKWEAVYEVRTARDRSSERMDEEAFDQMLAADVEHSACLKRVNGHTRLLIDGEIAFPTAYRAKGAFGKDILLETFAGGQVVREGVRLVVKGIAMGGSTSAADGLRRRYWTPQGFDAIGAARDIKNSLRIVPGALCLLSIGCNAYPDFTIKEHPDQVWLREDGSVVKGTSGSCVTTYHDMGMIDTNYWPWISYASPAWRQAINSNLRQLVAELKRQGIAKRIVGLHLWGYHDGQFNAPFEDHSPMAKAEYERYLKEDPLAVKDFAYFSKQLGFKAQEEFARTFKQALGKPAVAVRWNMGAFNGMPDVTSFAFSDAIDIIVPQPHYENRRPAMASEMILPYSSFDLHNKMYWNEFDLRTYAALDPWASTGVVTLSGDGNSEDFPMWQTIYRKLAGSMLASYSGYWFYDMGGGWYSAPEIAHDIGESMKSVIDILRRQPSEWRPDMAIVADEEGFGIHHAMFDNIGSRKNAILRGQLQLFAACGVPYEYYLAEDVLRDPAILKDTKTLVLAGFRNIDARRRDWLRKMADNGRTLVFLAESGIFAGVEETGFKVNFSTNSFEHVIVPAAGVPVDEARCLMTSTYRRFWPKCRPSGPRGAIVETEGVRALARYESDGAAAVAEKREAKCHRVYVAEYEALSPTLLNRLARESGAYVPVTGCGVQVNMNGDFISVHAMRTGCYAFRLPFPAKVVNLKTRRPERTEADVLTLTLTAGETCWFALEKR